MLLKNIFVLLLIIIGVLNGTFCIAQEDRILKPSQLQSDFELLVSTLNDVHPSLYSFISEDDLNQIITETNNKLSSEMHESEFHILIRKLIRQIGCGHTVARPSKNWYSSLKSPSVLPFSVYIIEDKLFIRNSFAADSTLKTGMEILSIDGRSNIDLLKEISSIQERDGSIESFSRSKIENLFSTYYLFLFGLKDNYEIEYFDLNSNQKKENIKGGISKKSDKKEIKKVSKPNEINIDHAHFYLSQDDPKTAFLDINSFHQKGYKNFYKKVFNELEDNKIKNLVLDLRNNGGGYFPNGNRLLRYLVDQKFEMAFNRPKNKVKKSPNLKMNFSSRMTRFFFNLIKTKMILKEIIL